jgi:hypothetical protein
VDITVEDEAANPIEGAEVTLEGIGTQTTDATGIALFTDVPPGTYSIDVVAEGFLAGTGSVQVINQDVSVTIVLEEDLGYYWIETFDTEIPSDWTTHMSGSDFLYWYDGKVIFFRQSWTDNPVMLVTPAIDIAPADMIYFDLGEQGNIPQDCAFGTVTDPSDPETFTELALFTPGVDWETFEYDLSNLNNTENEVYFAWKMTAPEVCYFSFDNVILTAGSVGSGKIQGFVRDAETNVAIDAAMITAENSDEETYTIETPFGAHYHLMLPVGNYTVSCISDGYVTGVVEDVEIVAGENVNHTFYLEPAKILTGIGEGDKMQTKVYPNPANDLVVVENASAIQQLEVINHVGQCVYKTNPHAKTLQIDVSNLNTGIYLIKISTADGVDVKQLMVQ